MPETTIDVEALYAALDAKRQQEDLSWRELAHKLKISPSTLTRMAQGRRPDVDAFATLLRWLGMSADAFMRPTPKKKEEANTVAMISSYLRADRNIEPQDAEALEDIIKAAYRHMTKKR
ncbi:MAG TPA: helix-turn-helix transcriptional regulator [Gemmataceae bacterium]|nr:helix-turn-helix transcriptional regulator [Gemmataceae bacterium]